MLVQVKIALWQDKKTIRVMKFHENFFQVVISGQ